MTYNDLYREVASLGFAPDLRDGDVLFFAVCRALRQLYEDCPVRTIVSIQKPTATAATIPAPRGTICYDMTKIVDNFMAFDGLPTKDDGEILCVLRTGTFLTVPSDVTCDILVPYRRLPALPEKGEPAAALDVPPGTEHLFSLLVSSYVWLDEDEEKAQYYGKRYEEGMARHRTMPSYTVPYTDVTGW